MLNAPASKADLSDGELQKIGKTRQRHLKHSLERGAKDYHIGIYNNLAMRGEMSLFKAAGPINEVRWCRHAHLGRGNNRKKKCRQVKTNKLQGISHSVLRTFYILYMTEVM